jgi:regulator of cell morphogenesis and NO signaling
VLVPGSTQSIREIVATQPSAAKVLERFDIDLCSRAGDSLDQACAELQLSVDQVLEKLEDAQAGERGASGLDPAIFPTSRLIQHIVRVHHQVVRQELPRLAELSHKLSTKRSERAPDLKPVETLIEELRADMFAHIQKEETVLFPFIAQMDQDSVIAYPPAHACFRSIAHPVFMMVQEHESAGQIVEKLRRVTHGFQVPPWACATHIALFAGLAAFETDLKQHVHLENDVLFPRAIEMEAALERQG